MPAIARTFAEVFDDMLRNLQQIVRAEVRLARSEIREEALKATSAAKFLGIGALAGFFSIAFLLVAAAAALTMWMPLWAAALIVCVALMAMAGLLLVIAAKRFQQVHAVPQRSIEHMKGDIQWVKQHAK